MTPTDIRDTAIPEDVMAAAGFVADGMDEAVRELKWGEIQKSIARAIMAATEAERERCLSAFRRIITEYAEDAQPGSEYRLACDDLLEALSNPAEEKDHD